MRHQTISRRVGARSGFTTNQQHLQQHTALLVMRRSVVTRKSNKMRICRFPSLAVLASSHNGIEKVRGSTPLISTTKVCVQYKGFRAFWSARSPAWNERCEMLYNILQHTRQVRPKGQKVCAQHETKANRVCVRQSRPVVLLGSAPRRKEAAASPA